MRKFTLSIIALMLCASVAWAQTGNLGQARDESNAPTEQGTFTGNDLDNPFLVPTGVLDTTNMIYDNGPMITNPGAGVGGANVSVLQGSLGMTSYGAGHAVSSGYRVADDFVVPAGQTWTINGATFYAYQTNSGNTSSINNVNFEILNGAPGVGTNVYGNTTTSALTHTSWAGIYRTTEAEVATSTARPVMKNHCNITGLTLGPGTYWINWQTGGTVASGPWANPVTIIGQTITGNAKQYDPTAMVWNPLNDGGTLTAQGLPFKLYGSITVGVNENLQSNTLQVYPNPATTLINVNSSININKITMCNYVGQKVFESTMAEKNMQINTSSFEKGIYFLTIETENGLTTRKVAVE